jgi:hypothetical protein
MPRMRTQPLLALVCVLVIMAAAGCRNDSTSATSQQPVTPQAQSKADARPQPAENELTVRIRKLGGADGKQLMNELVVATPIGDDFAVTEQVGARQLEFRGKVLDLKDGRYRVSYDYAETSADGRQQLKSLIEMRANDEKEVGGVQGAAGMETVVLSLSRP